MRECLPRPYHIFVYVEESVGSRSIAVVICIRTIGEKQAKELRYFITSLPSNAERILYTVRKRCGIESERHWTLDVAVNQDYSPARKVQAPENFAFLRHIAFNLLKQEVTAKGGYHNKQLQAGWNKDYLHQGTCCQNLDAITWQITGFSLCYRARIAKLKYHLRDHSGHI